MSARSELEDLFVKWFTTTHDGLTFVKFTGLIAADILKVKEAAAREETSIAAVRALHHSVDWGSYKNICAECSHYSEYTGCDNRPVDYPCPTILTVGEL